MADYLNIENAGINKLNIGILWRGGGNSNIRRDRNGNATKVIQIDKTTGNPPSAGQSPVPSVSTLSTYQNLNCGINEVCFLQTFGEWLTFQGDLYARSNNYIRAIMRSDGIDENYTYRNVRFDIYISDQVIISTSSITTDNRYFKINGHNLAYFNGNNQTNNYNIYIGTCFLGNITAGTVAYTEFPISYYLIVKLPENSKNNDIIKYNLFFNVKNTAQKNNPTRPSPDPNIPNPPAPPKPPSVVDPNPFQVGGDVYNITSTTAGYKLSVDAWRNHGRGYWNIYYQKQGTASWTKVRYPRSGYTTATTAQDPTTSTGLTAGTKYNFYIEAWDSDGSGDEIKSYTTNKLAYFQTKYTPARTRRVGGGWTTNNYGGAKIRKSDGSQTTPLETFEGMDFYNSDPVNGFDRYRNSYEHYQWVNQETKWGKIANPQGVMVAKAQGPNITTDGTDRADKIPLGNFRNMKLIKTSVPNISGFTGTGGENIADFSWNPAPAGIVKFVLTINGESYETTATNYQVDNLPAGEYEAQLVGVDANGNSSNILWTTVTITSYIPSKIDGLGAYIYSNGTSFQDAHRLYWNAQTVQPDFYEIQIFDATGELLLTTTTIEYLDYNDATIDETIAMQFSFRVRAYKTGQYGAWSDQYDVSVPARSVAPASLVLTTNTANNEITANWTAVAGATSYLINYYNPDGTITTQTATSTTDTITGITENGDWGVEVMAVVNGTNGLSIFDTITIDQQATYTTYNKIVNRYPTEQDQNLWFGDSNETSPFATSRIWKDSNQNFTGADGTDAYWEAESDGNEGVVVKMWYRTNTQNGNYHRSGQKICRIPNALAKNLQYIDSSFDATLSDAQITFSVDEYSYVDTAGSTTAQTPPTDMIYTINNIGLSSGTWDTVATGLGNTSTALPWIETVMNRTDGQNISRNLPIGWSYIKITFNKV